MFRDDSDDDDDALFIDDDIHGCDDPGTEHTPTESLECNLLGDASRKGGGKEDAHAAPFPLPPTRKLKVVVSANHDADVKNTAPRENDMGLVDSTTSPLVSLGKRAFALTTHDTHTASSSKVAALETPSTREWCATNFAVDCLLYATIKRLAKECWGDIQRMATYNCTCVAATLRADWHKIICQSNCPPTVCYNPMMQPLKNVAPVEDREGRIPYVACAIIQLTSTQILPAFIGLYTDQARIVVHMDVYGVDHYDLEWHANSFEHNFRTTSLIAFDGDDEFMSTSRTLVEYIDNQTLLEERELDPTRKHKHPFASRVIEGAIPFMRLRCADVDEVQSLRLHATQRADMFDLHKLESIASNKEGELHVDLSSLLFELHATNKEIQFQTELMNEPFDQNLCTSPEVQCGANGSLGDRLVQATCVDEAAQNTLVALSTLLLWGNAYDPFTLQSPLNDDVLASPDYDEEVSFPKSVIDKLSSDAADAMRSYQKGHEASPLTCMTFGDVQYTTYDGSFESFFNHLMESSDAFTRRREYKFHCLIWDDQGGTWWYPYDANTRVSIGRATFECFSRHKNVIQIYEECAQNHRSRFRITYTQHQKINAEAKSSQLPLLDAQSSSALQIYSPLRL